MFQFLQSLQTIYVHNTLCTLFPTTEVQQNAKQHKAVHHLQMLKHIKGVGGNQV